MQPIERKFLVNDLEIAAQQWGDGSNRILAIHGWLDNSASFSALASQLDQCQLIALDLAGHGLSSHRSAHGSYNIWDDLIDIIAIADQLEWNDFILLGHSRGAIVSFMLASSLPHRVSRLIMLDGILASAEEVVDAPKQLGRYVEDQLANSKKTPLIQKSRNEALSKRAKKAGVSNSDCTPLVERSMNLIDNEQFQWRHDQRIFGASALKLTREHQLAFFATLEVPSLLLLAKEGLFQEHRIQMKIPQHHLIKTVSLPGSHHMHMDHRYRDAIADQINTWLLHAS